MPTIYTHSLASKFASKIHSIVKFGTFVSLFSSLVAVTTTFKIEDLDRSTIQTKRCRTMREDHESVTHSVSVLGLLVA